MPHPDPKQEIDDKVEVIRSSLGSVVQNLPQYPLEMKLRTCIILAAFLALSTAAAAEDDDAFGSKRPGKLVDSKTLKEFVKLVEEKKLNVTVVTSQEEKWSNGNSKQSMSMAVTFPTYDGKAGSSALKKADVQKILDAGRSETLPARGHLLTETEELVNSRQGFPTTMMIQVLQGNAEAPEENFAAQYTFLSPGPDGKGETTHVLFADLTFEVVHRKNIDDVELKKARKTLAAAIFMFEGNEVPRVVVEVMDKAFPEQNWQAAKIGGMSHLDSEKFVILKGAVGEDGPVTWAIFTA